MLDLSIIILNYKYKGLVKNCLRNVKADNLPLDYEIIVVDNGSHDGVDKMVEENFPDVKLVMLPENKGFSGGNNAGIKVAKGRYILILNPDITVLPGAIMKLYDFMREHPEIGAISPQLLNPDGTIQRSCMKFHHFFIPVYRRLGFIAWLPFVKKELKQFEMDDWDHNSNREVDWMLGACLLLRKDILDKVGFFDERFFLFFDDTDICRRINLAGWKIYYLSEAKVIHLDERLSKKGKGLLALKNKTTWIHISSWMKYFWKWRKFELNLTEHAPLGKQAGTESLK